MREILGETTISGRGVVNLPARVLKKTGLQPGDRVLVEVDDGLIILMKRPQNIGAAWAGRLTHLFPSEEENRQFLAEERASWDRDQS